MDELDAEAEKFERACDDNEDGAHSFSTEGTCACGAIEGMPDPDRDADPDPAANPDPDARSNPRG